MCLNLVPAFLQTRWGTHSLTAAIRALLKEALNDAMNHRFVLLSEWDIPLYPPTVIYVQLMAEQHSRITACPGPMVRSQFHHLLRVHMWFQAQINLFPCFSVLWPKPRPYLVTWSLKDLCTGLCLCLNPPKKAWTPHVPSFGGLSRSRSVVVRNEKDFAKLSLSITQPELLVPLVCMQFKMKPGRWAGGFQNSSFGFQHWRRADTWFILIRRHAEIVAEDRTVEREFAENCQHIDTNISRQPCPTLASSSVYNQMALCGHSWLYKDPKYLHHFSDKSSGAASFFLNALLHITQTPQAHISLVLQVLDGSIVPMYGLSYNFDMPAFRRRRLV